MTEINKAIVKKRFERSSSTYNVNAETQKSISQRLIDKITCIDGLGKNRVLEIGCGTGFLTDRLLNELKPEEFYINDINEKVFPEIEEIAGNNNFKNYKLIPGDAEELLFPDNLDLVISTSTFQWFNNLKSFIQNIANVIKKDGYLAFSSFGISNFKEIKATANIALNYTPLDDLNNWLNEDFEIKLLTEYTETLFFSSPIDVLKHMKLTGVNAVSNKFFGRKQYCNFIINYQKYFSQKDRTVPLTYNPILVIAKIK